ncbi:MAG: hypothetical protein H8D67_08355 [Deltaproteobacteria bacterium]|nr:hypothetical protein [Deltaproteobacteria bacterium]
MFNKNTVKNTRIKLILLSTILVLAAYVFANADILFVDDFEKDEIGKEPSKWEHFDFFGGNSHFTIGEDPTDSKNKLVKTTGIGQYVPNVAGRENWGDYIWDFDWIWENDSFVGTLYRIEDADNCFHASRRTGGTDFQIYACKGAWGGALVTSQYPNELNVWYSHRLVLKGSKHEIYLKERNDSTPFEELEPVIEVDDDTFKNGPVGIMGITSGLAYYDNIVVYESPADLTDVSPAGKLAQIWGKIKKH